jgi:quercetin dioxygenase-like cupin family protein
MNRILVLLVSILFISCNSATNDTQHTHDEIHPDLQYPILVKPDAGKTWNIFGLQIVGRIMSDQTGGEYAVIQSKTPPGGGPPMHVHQNEDELFYVLEGLYKFTCGDSVMMAEKGALVHLPRGIPHGFENVGDSTGVLMNTITPGGFENFFEEIDQLSKDSIPDREIVKEIALKYNLKFVQ